MNIKCVITFLISVILSGCASCPIQTFNKVTPVKNANGVLVHTDGPNTVLNLERDVTINVNSCWNTGLCAKISLPEGRRFQFTTNEFMELDIKSGAVTQIHKTDRIYYVVTCEERKTMPRTCISSESSPTSVEVDVTDTSNKSHNDWEWQIYKKAFSSTLEFIGASEIKGSLSKPLFSLKGQREYQLPIFMEHKADIDSYIVRFPMVIIDGKSQKLPDIRVARVNESLCNYRAW
jgi:hypothetical protein